jgi:hypothetical protein
MPVEAAAPALNLLSILQEPDRQKREYIALLKKYGICARSIEERARAISGGGRK